jgi:hypothetical protein
VSANISSINEIGCIIECAAKLPENEAVEIQRFRSTPDDDSSLILRRTGHPATMNSNDKYLNEVQVLRKSKVAK